MHPTRVTTSSASCNFLAAPGTPYTLKIARQTAGPDVITISGKTEAWHMTLRDARRQGPGERDVTVWRGDVSTQDFSCGQAAPSPVAGRQPATKKAEG